MWAALLAAVACAPKATALEGTPAPASLPRVELPDVHRKIVFDWRFRDGEYSLRGDGVARIAPPDSVRLDFFVNNEPSGVAILVGDSLRLPPKANVVRKALPPPPLLWAALGRLHTPAASDTVARVDGDTLRMDIGQDPRWRATMAGGELRRLDLIQNGRIPQSVVRSADGSAHYTHATANRSLDFTVTHVDTLPGFDATIWQ